MSAESGLRVRIDYEDVAELKSEVKQLSSNFEVLTDKMDEMSSSMSSVEDHSAKANKKLALIAGIKKLELVGHLANLHGRMLEIGRASPLLASNMAVVDWQMEQLGMIVGDAIAPAFEVLGNALEDVMNWWEKLDQPTKDAIATGIQVAFMLGVVALAWTALNTAMAPIIIVIVAIGLAVAGLILIWNEFGDEIMVVVEEAIDVVMGIFDSFLDFLDNLFQDPLGTMIQLWLDWQTLLYGTLADLFTNLIPDLIDEAFKIVTDLFSGFGIDIGNELGFIKDIIDNMIKAWAGIFQAFADFFGTVFSDPIGAVQTLFSDLVDVVIGYIGGLIDIIGAAFVDLASDAVDWGANIISGIVDGAISAVDSLFGSVIDAIMDFWPFSPAKKGPFSGTGLIDAGFNFISSLVDGMINGIAELIPGALGGIIDLIPDAVGAGVDLATGITSGVGDVIGGGLSAVGLGGGTGFSDLSLEQQRQMIPAMRELLAKIEAEGSGNNMIAVMLRSQIEDYDQNNPTGYEFQRGGRVPGSLGTEVPIIAHAEELILTAGQEEKIESALDFALTAINQPALDFDLPSTGGGDKTTNNVTYNVTVNSSGGGGVTGFQQGRGIGEGLTQKLRSKGLGR